MTIENRFKNAALSAGISFDDAIIADGNLHRCHIKGHRSGSKNGAYVLHTSGVPAGWGLDYKSGISFKWQADGQLVRLSATDIAAIETAKLERQNQLVKGYQQAALKAGKIWHLARFADPSNGYCHHKNIQPHGAKTGVSGVLKDVLILPLYNVTLELVNIQFIKTDGQKRFLSGGQKQSCFWWLGKKTPTILIAEGFATAASLHEHTGLQTFIAYDAGNISNVARIIRAKNPDADIIICGDNDKSGTGQKAARLAALAVSAKYLIPCIAGHDWNDVLNAGV